MPSYGRSPFLRSIVSLLLCPAADTEIYIWDVEGGRQEVSLSGHTQGISDVAWARDQRYLASGSDDKSIRLWDVETVRVGPVV
jgi:COMPASS component SWD3